MMFAAVLIFFLYVPIAIMVIFSFNEMPRLSLPIDGLSLRWYKLIFTDPAFTSAIINSVIVASATAVVTFVLGTLAALGLASVPTRLRGILAILFFAPITVPGLFLGLSLLTFFSELDIKLSLATVAAGHLVYTFPYFLLFARAALDRLDPQLNEIGADLGASPIHRFRRVTFPLVRPILLAAAFLAFALSFDEFVITFFVIGPQSTVPLVVWSIARRSIDPSINALATLLLFVTVLGTMLMMSLIMAKQYARKAVVAER